MTDARLPERWLNDRRLRRLPDDVFRLFVMSLMWSVANRTDGVLTEDDLALIPGGENRGAVSILAMEHLWTVCRRDPHDARGDHYWLILDYEETQTTRADLNNLAAGRRSERDKKRRQRAHAAGDHHLCGNRPCAAVLWEGGMDAAARLTRDDGRPVSVREMLLSMIEEYARHTGHADLLRESVDGLVGEGAPPEFRL